MTKLKTPGKLPPAVQTGAGSAELLNCFQLPVRMLTFIDSTIELKDNTIIVVFGASGDLAKKKTVSSYSMNT